MRQIYPTEIEACSSNWCPINPIQMAAFFCIYPRTHLRLKPSFGFQRVHKPRLKERFSLGLATLLHYHSYMHECWNADSEKRLSERDGYLLLYVLTKWWTGQGWKQPSYVSRATEAVKYTELEKSKRGLRPYPYPCPHLYL